MNTGKLKAVVFIIVFLLLLALVVHWAMGQDEKRREAREEEEETETVEKSKTEQQAEPQPQETPEPQPQGFIEIPSGYAPAPTPPPARPQQQQQPQQQQPQPQQQQPQPQQQQQEEYVAPPAPTPPPEQPQQQEMPSGQFLGSDSFRSDTGTGLNMICDWSAVSVEGNQAKVTVTISVESFSLYLSNMGNNVFVSVGGQTGALAQPELEHDGGYTVTTFGTLEFTLPLAEGSNDFSVAVEWHYNGSYSGVAMDVIECGGTITLTR